MPRHDCKFVKVREIEADDQVEIVCERGCGLKRVLTEAEWADLAQQQRDRDGESQR